MTADKPVRNQGLSSSALIKILFIALLALLVVGGGCGFFMFYRGPLFDFNRGFALVDTQDWTVGSGTIGVGEATVENLSVDWLNGDLLISSSEGKDIQIVEYSNSGLSTSEQVHWAIQDGTLFIQDGRGGFGCTSRIWNDQRVEVRLPHALAQGLSIVTIGCASGNVRVSNLTCAALTTSIASGDVKLEQVTTSESRLDAASGKIAATGLDASTLSIALTSGEITVSGSYQSIDLGVTSGSAIVRSAVAPQQVSVDLTSGDATILIPEGKGFTAEVDKLSGTFNCSFVTTNTTPHTYVFKDGTAPYRFDITSGTVNLQKA